MNAGRSNNKRRKSKHFLWIYFNYLALSPKRKVGTADQHMPAKHGIPLSRDGMCTYVPNMYGVLLPEVLIRTLSFHFNKEQSQFWDEETKTPQ